MEESREFRLDEISFFSIFKDIIKNIWVIILAAAAGWLAVTGARRLTWTPEYSSSATLAVTAKGSSSNAYSSLNLTTQMAEIFSEVFSSNVLRDKIAEELGQDSVDAEISASIIQETNLVVVRVTSASPSQTYRVIQSAIDNYSTVSDYLFSNAVLRTVQEPAVPVGPSNAPNISRMQKLAMIGGAGLTGVLIIVFSVMRFTVKTKEGARRNLDGRILETIPYEHKNKTLRGALRKNKTSLLMSTSLVSMRFSESCRKLATQVDHHMRTRKQKVLLVTSVAENEGKSSAAANLALALSEKGRSVILIDTDLKKPAQSKIFDIHGKSGHYLTDYLDRKASVGQILRKEGEGNLFLVLQYGGVKSSARYLDSKEMRGLIRAAGSSVDYVILDSSPLMLSSDALILTRLADAVLLVARQDWSDIRALNDAADDLRQTDTDFMGFVLNAFRDGRQSGGKQEYSYYGYHRRQRGKAGEE